MAPSAQALQHAFIWTAHHMLRPHTGPEMARAGTGTMRERTWESLKAVIADEDNDIEQNSNQPADSATSSPIARKTRQV